MSAETFEDCVRLFLISALWAGLALFVIGKILKFLDGDW